MSIFTGRFPTLFGLGLLTAGLVGGIFLVRHQQTISPRAAEIQLAPLNPLISNISDRSFTVSWTTSAPVNGSIKIGGSLSDLNQKISETASIASLVHSVTADNLDSSTKYYFQIGESPFSITTAAPLDQPPAPDTAQGIIKTRTGLPADNVLVYIQLSGGQLLSTATTSSGNWLIPLSTARSGDLANWLTFDRSSLTYTIQAEGGSSLGQSTAVVTTALDRPVPPIILGNSYDFRQSQEPISSISANENPTPSISPSAEESGFSFDSFGKVPAIPAKVTLDNPSVNQEKLSTAKPEFFGSGPADTEINITVHSSENIIAKTTVANSGQWSFSPPKSLSDGLHTISLTWTDANGIVQTLNRSFIVNASAGEPAFTSTPSATPTKKITPKFTSPTGGPTTAPRKTIPSTRSAVPQSGDLTPSLIIFIMGIILTFVGFTVVRRENYHGS